MDNLLAASIAGERPAKAAAPAGASSSELTSAQMRQELASVAASDGATSSDAAAFSRNLKLSRGFLSVQALLCSIGAAAFPGAASVFGFAAFECMLTLAARELIEGLPRANEKLGWAWAAVIANWIPFTWLYVDVYVPAYVYFVGMFLWVHWTFYITLFMIPLRLRLLHEALVAVAFFQPQPLSPLGQPAEGLMVVCSLVVGELLSFTWRHARDAAPPARPIVPPSPSPASPRPAPLLSSSTGISLGSSMSSASDDERRLAPSMHDEELHLVRLRPWTLSFDGGASAAALEADFTAERFRAACAPLVVFCTAFM